MIKDGLWDASGDVHMGVCAEQCATTQVSPWCPSAIQLSQLLQNISREQQDNFAVSSYTRAAAAAAAGKFDNEIAPIEVLEPIAADSLLHAVAGAGSSERSHAYSEPHIACVWSCH